MASNRCDKEREARAEIKWQQDCHIFCRAEDDSWGVDRCSNPDDGQEGVHERAGGGDESVSEN